MKKLLALFLALLMCSCVLIGCKKDNKDDDQGAQLSDTDPNRDAPEVKDFGGYTFKMMVDSWEEYEVAAPEALIGEGINDQVFERNKTIESLYNIKIKQDFNTNETKDAAFAFLLSMSSSQDYFADLYSHDVDHMIGSFAPQGYFLNLHDLKSLRLDKEYWDQEYIAETSINNHLYTITGDIQTNDDRHEIFLGMNLTLFNNTYQDKNIYNILVKDGNWTFDTFFEIWQSFPSLDEGTPGKVDAGDMVAYGYDGMTASYYFLSSGVKSFKIENNAPVLNFQSDKSVKIIDLLQKVVDGNSGLKSGIAGGEGTTPTGTNTFTYDTVRQHFQNGKLLFVSNNFGDALGWYLNMENDVVYLPFPKYEKGQTEYYTPVHKNFEPFAVSANVEDPERTALIFEAIACYSDKLETEVMDILIQERLSTNLEAREILQTTLRAKVYDMDYLANVSGFRDSVNPLLRDKKLDQFTSTMKKAEGVAVNTRGTGNLQLFLEKYAGIKSR